MGKHTSASPDLVACTHVNDICVSGSTTLISVHFPPVSLGLPFRPFFVGFFLCPLATCCLAASAPLIFVLSQWTLPAQFHPHLQFEFLPLCWEALPQPHHLLHQDSWESLCLYVGVSRLTFSLLCNQSNISKFRSQRVSSWLHSLVRSISLSA